MVRCHQPLNAILKTLYDMGQEQNSMLLPFKLNLEKCFTENGQVYLCNIADVTENKWVTRAKPGRKTLISKNAADVTGTSKTTH